MQVDNFSIKLQFQLGGAFEAEFLLEGEGLKLTKRGKWRTAPCVFHGSKDSLRINTSTGAFVCMAGCGAKGGDVLAYRMAAHGEDFVTAAKALGCWSDDGKPVQQQKPTPIPARAALQALSFEALLVAVEAARISKGAKPTEADKARVLAASNRIIRIAEVFA